MRSSPSTVLVMLVVVDGTNCVFGTYCWIRVCFFSIVLCRPLSSFKNSITSKKCGSKYVRKSVGPNAHLHEAATRTEPVCEQDRFILQTSLKNIHSVRRVNDENRGLFSFTKNRRRKKRTDQ